MILILKIIKYYKSQSNNVIKRTKRNSLVTILEISDTRRRKSHSMNFVTKNFENTSLKKIRNTQKSHFSILIVSNIWYLLTSIPYFILNTFFILLKLKFYPNIFDIKTVIIVQIVSSILFNSNHCLNFFIYFSFYDEFRHLVLKRFSKYRFNKILSKYSQSSRSTNSIKLNMRRMDSAIVTMF